MNNQVELTLEPTDSRYMKRGGGSLIHEELSLRSLHWLAQRSSGRGIRGGTEIQLAQGYIADAVALGGLQTRFYRRYCHLSGLSEEIGSYEIRGEKIIQYKYSGDWYNTFVFEVKVSRQDFLSTFSRSTGKQANRHEPIGGLHWIVAPKGIVSPDEVPDFWGLLVAHGRGLSEKKPPQLFNVKNEFLKYVAEEILWYGAGAKYSRLGLIPTCPDCLRDYSDSSP